MTQSAFANQHTLLPGLSIVIPVYNSAQSLPALILALEKSLLGRATKFEVILVNDGSKDQSWDVIRDLAEKHPMIRGMNLTRNYGQHNALLCGIRAASFDVTVTMDDDLQHPPEEIVILLNKLDEGYDVVYGTPELQRHGIWRDAASTISKIALSAAMGAEAARKVSAFRVFRTQMRDAFDHYQGPFVSVDVLLTWGTTHFAAVEVRHDVRRIGKSNYTFRKLVTHALNMMTGFSVVPLQLASVVGFLFTLFGIVVLIYVVGRFLLQGDSVPGFPFLASVIAIFSGAQLFALGIIGEYLARMHFRVMDKPPYAIRSATRARDFTDLS